MHGPAPSGSLHPSPRACQVGSAASEPHPVHLAVPLLQDHPVLAGRRVRASRTHDWLSPSLASAAHRRARHEAAQWRRRVLHEPQQAVVNGCERLWHRRAGAGELHVPPWRRSLSLPSRGAAACATMASDDDEDLPVYAWRAGNGRQAAVAAAPGPVPPRASAPVVVAGTIDLTLDSDDDVDPAPRSAAKRQRTEVSPWHVVGGCPTERRTQSRARSSDARARTKRRRQTVRRLKRPAPSAARGLVSRLGTRATASPWTTTTWTCPWRIAWGDTCRRLRLLQRLRRG